MYVKVIFSMNHIGSVEVYVAELLVCSTTYAAGALSAEEEVPNIIMWSDASHHLLPPFKTNHGCFIDGQIKITSSVCSTVLGIVSSQ